MNGVTKILDKVSGYFFLTGFISSKLNNIPHAFLAAVFGVASIAAYLIGYLAWYAATLLYPEHPGKMNRWYAFADFRQQYQLAALLGIAATIMCVIAPLSIVPTAWIYTLSNLTWSVGEYHKKQNPHPDDVEYSSARQALYLRYSLLVTSSSALTAITATIAFLFPPAAFTVITSAAILGAGFMIPSLYYVGQYAFGNHKPDHVVDHSHSKMAAQLTSTLDYKPPPTPTRPTLAPPHHKSPLAANDASVQDMGDFVPAHSMKTGV